jgi:ubiquinone/menaquinone biosynthesis C-methylase UbiE
MPNNQRGNPFISYLICSISSFIRVFYKLLYHQFAWTYDCFASIVSFGKWQTWVHSVLPYLNGPRTLELGFGSGHLQKSLLQKGISAYGLDESSQMAQITRRRINRFSKTSNLVRGDAETLPYANESFNQVVSTFPAEFLLNRQTFNEIYRVLINGGAAFILPFVWIKGHNPLERSLAWLYRITGETQDWDERTLEPLKDLGFDVSWMMINFSFSQILIIQLIKYPLSGQD